MLSWILQMTVLSIIFIFLIHHLILFFKENLTVPKIKDLVNAPSQKYKDMYKIISQDKENMEESISKLSNSKEYHYDYSKEDLLPKPDVENMKNELKSFLKEQLQQSSSSSIAKNTNVNTNISTSSTEIISLDSGSSYDNYYSSY